MQCACEWQARTDLPEGANARERLVRVAGRLHLEVPDERLAEAEVGREVDGLQRELQYLVARLVARDLEAAVAGGRVGLRAFLVEVDLARDADAVDGQRVRFRALRRRRVGGVAHAESLASGRGGCHRCRILTTR